MFSNPYDLIRLGEDLRAIFPRLGQITPIQRYEATRYAGASLARIQAVADALGLKTEGRVVLPTERGS